ncbi:MAG: ribosome biogenesis GTP-binding protein YihA/YsxC [Saprospiraceae bacterium]|jgi:GTP-binding protein
MSVHFAAFAGSYPGVHQCPDSDKPEFAFIGRSNVGKSSLINAITGHKSLAHTSNTPGKTQLINYFLINRAWHLVDLPGYGYARISKTKREKWRKMVQDYLVLRPQLLCAFVLIDSNVLPQAIDLEFINWLGEMHVPFVLVFTKTDKKKVDHESNILAFQNAMLEEWETLPPCFSTSSATGQGIGEVLQYIQHLIEQHPVVEE